MLPGRPNRPTSEDVFGRYRSRIYGHIRSLVRRPSDAEDLTQETFLRAHRQLDTLEDPAALRVWLYRIATHVCYDFLRASRRRPDLQAAPDPEAEQAAADGPRLDQLVDRADMSACIQQFLEDLPDSYRAAILMHDLHDLSDAEMARLLGCTRGAVKARLHRARTQLKARLQAGCEFTLDERGVFVCGRKAGSQPAPSDESVPVTLSPPLARRSSTHR